MVVCFCFFSGFSRFATEWLTVHWLLQERTGRVTGARSNIAEGANVLWVRYSAYCIITAQEETAFLSGHLAYHTTGVIVSV